MRSLAIDCTISLDNTPGTLKPINISAPLTAPAKLPLASTANSNFCEVKSDRLLEIIPFESHIQIVFAPALRNKRATAIPEAPAPLITILTSSRLLLTSLRAFKEAAKVTIAVPSWSSWKTGMSNSLLNFSSISKQRGALISSKLTPPKTGAIFLTSSIISSAF